MRSPLRPLPESVERWSRRARWFRWLDAGAGWLALWVGAAAVLPALEPTQHAVLAAAGLGVAAAVPPLRLRWRPVSAAVGLHVSRTLRPGDRAWYVGPEGAERVLVTASRGLRMRIAGPARDEVEGVAVRRTRVLLIPADH